MPEYTVTFLTSKDIKEEIKISASSLDDARNRVMALIEDLVEVQMEALMEALEKELEEEDDKVDSYDDDDPLYTTKSVLDVLEQPELQSLLPGTIVKAITEIKTDDRSAGIDDGSIIIPVDTMGIVYGKASELLEKDLYLKEGCENDILVNFVLSNGKHVTYVVSPETEVEVVQYPKNQAPQTIRYTHDQLVDIIAKIMSYSSGHFFDEYRKRRGFKNSMEVISMCVACWLAQNTNDGIDGVEWDVVYNDLIESKIGDSLEKFKAIAEKHIKNFGGVCE